MRVRERFEKLEKSLGVLGNYIKNKKGITIGSIVGASIIPLLSTYAPPNGYNLAENFYNNYVGLTRYLIYDLVNSQVSNTTKVLDGVTISSIIFGIPIFGALGGYAIEQTGFIKQQIKERRNIKMERDKSTLRDRAVHEFLRIEDDSRYRIEQGVCSAWYMNNDGDEVSIEATKTKLIAKFKSKRGNTVAIKQSRLGSDFPMEIIDNEPQK